MQLQMCRFSILCDIKIYIFPMTEAKVESKDADSEERARGAEASPAVSSQPQRIPLFTGMDPSALKVSLNIYKIS